MDFGPSGETVYRRTYSRTKPDGSKETWPETVARVAEGNIALVYGPRETWPEDIIDEHDQLVEMMESFKLLPAGRHLWATGVKGRELLQNCFVSGWAEKLSEHFAFTLSRLTEGGGVGANYSTYLTGKYGPPRRQLKLHAVCDSDHADYAKMVGTLSEDYVSEWPGAFVIEDSREGWAAALADLIDTFYADEVRHVDRVYDVSRVRPEGARLKTFGGTASGPAPLARMLATVAHVLNAAFTADELTPLDLMEIDHGIAQCVISGGVRRSARMSIVHWRDPFIDSFLQCKSDYSSHYTTNISVEVDQEFFAALDNEDAEAHRILRRIAAGMLANGEPGVWNSSLANEGELQTVHATNPCGEIALAEWEPCNLGHVNLEAFAPKTRGEDPDYFGLLDAHRLMTRFLVRATFGTINDEKQAEVVARNRRIGVGHTGVQGFLAKTGVSYSQASKLREFELSLIDMYAMVRTSADEYCFKLRQPACIKVTTVAPTGTISKMPGVSEGIHPIYARYFERRMRFSSIRPEEREQVEDARASGYVVEDDIYDRSGNTKVVVYPTQEKLVKEVSDMSWPDAVVESVDELTLRQMLDFQVMYQQHYADNGISFTANVADGVYSADELMVILREYMPKLKGTTLMVDASRPQAPYTRISREDYELQAYLATADSSMDEECRTGACPIR